MSIKTDNRSIALKALEAFQAFETKYLKQGQADAEKAKHLLNAVQQASLKLGTQGLRRCMLYVSGQMAKDKAEETAQEPDGSASTEAQAGKKQDSKKAFNLAQAYFWLYGQMAQFAGQGEAGFQHYLLVKAEAADIAVLEARLAFFLRALKGLAHQRYMECKPENNKAS